MDIASAIDELTKDSAASVLFYEVAGADPESKYEVVVNSDEPPLPIYYSAGTFAEALAQAIAAKRKESES